MIAIDSLRHPLRWLLAALSLCAGCEGCSAHKPAGDPDLQPGFSAPMYRDAKAPGSRINLNQLGFYPGAPKLAVVPDIDEDVFSLVSASGVEVFSGTLTEAEHWPYSGETVRLADFSGFSDPGVYRVKVAGLGESDPFPIAKDVHFLLNRSALKAYYYNRSGMALDARFAGPWLREAAHPDTRVTIHRSAASATRPAGTSIAAPGGWYDAGDYNKYVVNSGIATYTLLAAYEHFPDFYAGLTVGIPESVNELPDILDEVLWNLRWMLQMQDPEDGGVYHKLTTLKFEPRVMPRDARSDRHVVQKSTEAALDFAAVLATASRVFAPLEQKFSDAALNALQLQNFSRRALQAAVAAWEWAKRHPEANYQQPADVSTGEYAISNLDSHFSWAAAELFISTGEEAYYKDFVAYSRPLVTPSWREVGALAYLSLLHHKSQLASFADTGDLQERFLTLADSLHLTQEQSAYGVAIGHQSLDFQWGSNAVALNQSLILIQAYRHTEDERFLHAAIANMDYVLGRNPLSLSYVTGFGLRRPMNIHHRQSGADAIDEPVPGFLAGGPHNGRQDGCTYGSDLPAKTYLDDWCSYSTNEVAINWNAPLVYVSGALEVLAP